MAHKHYSSMGRYRSSTYQPRGTRLRAIEGPSEPVNPYFTYNSSYKYSEVICGLEVKSAVASASYMENSKKFNFDGKYYFNGVISTDYFYKKHFSFLNKNNPEEQVISLHLLYGFTPLPKPINLSNLSSKETLLFYVTTNSLEVPYKFIQLVNKFTRTKNVFLISGRDKPFYYVAHYNDELLISMKNEILFYDKWDFTDDSFMEMVNWIGKYLDHKYSTIQEKQKENEIEEILEEKTIKSDNISINNTVANLSFSKEQAEFMEKYKSLLSINLMQKHNFTIEQLEQIVEAEQEDKLSVESISKFAHPKYSANHMLFMRMAYIDEMPFQCIECIMYAQDELIAERILEIFHSNNQTLIDKAIVDMKIRKLEIKGLKSVSLMRKYDFTLQQINQIAEAETSGVQMHYLTKLANPKYSHEHIKVLRQAMKHDVTEDIITRMLEADSEIEALHIRKNPFDVTTYKKYTEEQLFIKIEKEKNSKVVHLMERHNFNIEQLKAIKEAEYGGLFTHQLNQLANPKYTASHMHKIINAIKNKLPQYEVEDLFANINNEDESTVDLTKFINEHVKYGYKSTKVMKQYDFNLEQLEVIAEAEDNGFSIGQIIQIAKPEIDANVMKRKFGLIHVVKQDTPEEKFILEAEKEGYKSIAIMREYDFSVSQLEVIMNAEDDSLTPEQIKLFAKPENNATKMEQFIANIKVNNAKQKAVQEYIANMELKGYESTKIMKNYDMDIEQLQVIIQAEKCGLNMEQIYGVVHWNHTDIESMKYKFDLLINTNIEEEKTEKLNLSAIQVKFINNAKEANLKSATLMEKHVFGFKQLKIIREAEEAGLNMEELTLLADPILNIEIMEELVEAMLEGAPFECIDYMKSATTIVEAREVLEAYL